MASALILVSREQEAQISMSMQYLMRLSARQRRSDRTRRSLLAKLALLDQVDAQTRREVRETERRISAGERFG